MPASVRAPSEVGLYIHVPFCLRRCPYCDFTIAVTSAPPELPYVDALLAELDARAGELEGLALRTVYLGGGTPGLLGRAAIERLARGLRDRQLNPSDELTVELNPERVSDEQLDAWLALGMTRASIGAQSLQPHVLSTLGRHHTACDVEHLTQRLHARGVRHVSLDLILGTPGATLDDLAADLHGMARLPGVDHLSIYELTWEWRTAFTVARDRGALTAWPDDALVDAFQLAADLAAQHGFTRYEVSSYARPGGRAAHNSAYWTGRPYVGIGPGAHSLRVSPDGAIIERRRNVPGLRHYLAHPAAPAMIESPIVEHMAGDRKAPGTAASDTSAPVSSVPVSGAPDRAPRAPVAERLTPRQHLFERLFTALRCVEGVDLGVLEDDFRVDLSALDPLLISWQARGFGVSGGRRFVPGAHGLLHGDLLAGEVHEALEG